VDASATPKQRGSATNETTIPAGKSDFRVASNLFILKDMKILLT
jgi:hypothetical protein